MMEKWKGWHLHHLARRAKIFGIEKPLVDTLEKVGWLLTRGKPVPDLRELDKALKRLGSIKDFDKTCEQSNCPICQRVVREYSKGFIPSKPWEMKIELYRWQKEAKKGWWENNGRGIIKVVTGAGKTVLALSLISDLYKSEAYKDNGLRTVIVVPTTVLLDQWLIELMDKLNLPRDKIAVFYGKEKDPIEDKKVLIYVVNSARKYLKEHSETYFAKDDVFLIVDECHRYGSKENSKIFDASYSYILGLSATPERFGDMGFEKKLTPNLGKIIYSYSYSDALKDGIIPPYKLIRLKVQLSKEEHHQYEEITKKISKLNRILFSNYSELKDCSPLEFLKKLGQLYEDTHDSVILKYISLLNQRKEIIHTSISKFNALKWLIENENLKNNRILLFHERIEFADKIFCFLKEKGFNVGIYHTDLPLNERIKNIADYRSGKNNIIVSCRALDEGFDVPESEIGIIVAGTSSVRQWIQRMGRILRKTPDKEYSRIFVIFVNIVERDVFRETELREFEKEALSVELINLTYQ
jgi:superfamily II DNA or RNA helicase